ncbi:hypothetical protein ACGFSB_01505 [Streptomyces sp. NPDC048441]|uniref:hypothetical protein n=1 Tax=Streptomyces sp. NPDC048441 TaxID=3365552 RepID=UPI003717DE46
MNAPRGCSNCFWRPLGAYEIRHQLAITAPHDVVEASRAAFVVLRDTRDLLMDSAAVESTAYRALEDRFDSAVAELRKIMRRDLGVSESTTRG